MKINMRVPLSRVTGHGCSTRCLVCGRPGAVGVCIEADSIGAEYSALCSEHETINVFTLWGYTCDECGEQPASYELVAYDDPSQRSIVCAPCYTREMQRINDLMSEEGDD